MQVMVFIIAFSFAGCLYLIVALQVSQGFPPLYEKYQGPTEDEIKPVLPFVFALMAIMLATTVFPPLFFLFGVVSIWCGLRIRKSVQVRTTGPLSWLLSPLTISTFNRWPMLAFDVWTIGINVFVGALVLMSG
ncbi:hypothetical protein PVW46_10895 [Mameliella sp. AT18]|uniref:hypothetical protein n=1 Tax=Mameliella TaxID=1434019 RepID=UPI000841000A|nr:MULTISPECIES: hypothetical protein [Mameliella]MDD9730417.1 hypothetical protein [Mameliella sp. AT18]ODM49075.1 hypothetical protein A9320_17555 [Ruegeria sp. PBVC088]